MISLKAHPGHFVENDFCDILFADKRSSPFFEATSDLHLCVLEQVHGSTVVKATPHEKIKADGHWTQSSGDVLLIKTADCLPIAITDSDRKIAMALHAGWRGVQKKITTQALKQLHFRKNPSVRFYIGPHIQKKSFEVDGDVALEIFSAHGITLAEALNTNLCFAANNKFLIDLSELVIREIETFGFNRDQICKSDIDTKTDINYYSFRRGDKGVRNYSAIRIK
jgi:polyphenol oxidase